MDDNVMYAWQVVGDYNYDYAHFTCARQETAEYLRDMMQAYEENNWRCLAEACNIVYVQRGDQEVYSIQECEVIL